jgi:hypothetical protein
MENSYFGACLYNNWLILRLISEKQIVIIDHWKLLETLFSGGINYNQRVIYFSSQVGS